MRLRSVPQKAIKQQYRLSSSSKARVEGHPSAEWFKHVLKTKWCSALAGRSTFPTSGKANTEKQHR